MLSAPRTLVRITGSSKGKAVEHVTTPLEWSVISNGHGVIDTAEVTLAVQGNPDWSQIAPAGDPITIRIYAGFPADPDRFSFPQLSLRFAGTVEPLDPSFNMSGQTAQLHCLSLGAVLAGAKTTTNLGQAGSADLSGITTAQYVQSVAKAHNMTADVRVSNPASMQLVYATQQIVSIHNLRIWDILIDCANTDGTYLWYSSRDNTLHYVDPAQISRSVIALQYGSLKNGLKSFDGSHAVQFSKNIEVEVRSYRDRVSVRSRARTTFDSSGNQSGVTVNTRAVSYTAQNFGNPGESVTSMETKHAADGSVTTVNVNGTSTTTGGETSSGYTSMPTDSTTEKYVYKFHGLTQAQCDARALVIWKWLSSHEFRGTFEIPVTSDMLADLDVTAKFQINALPWSSFDQGYIPLRLTENFSMSAGWNATVMGINHRAPNGMI